MQAIAEIECRLARPRVLVNGPMRPVYAAAGSTTDDLTADVMGRAERIYRWNRVLGSRMASSGGGVIVNFAYGFAERGVSGASAFSMSQAAIVAATRSLAIEWAATKVRVCGVGLGWYETEPRPIEEQRQERLVRFLPLRRKGTPADATGLMVYMASGAAGFVSGQTVWVDGGAMAHA
jgi:NAD(P)-dependent dehydrogenase (short-subunit alcohol dehydrogenase family)